MIKTYDGTPLFWGKKLGRCGNCALGGNVRKHPFNANLCVKQTVCREDRSTFENFAHPILTTIPPTEVLKTSDLFK